VMERREDAHAGEKASRDVGEGRPHLDWRAPGAVPRNALTRSCPGRQIEPSPLRVWAGSAEAGDRAVDQPWIDPPQLVVAEAHSLRRPEPIILRDDVGPAKNLLQNPLPALRLQIDGDSALAPVHHRESCRFVADRRRDGAALIVSARDFLDLDDVRSLVGQHEGRRWDLP
jgi:hypothetical protein